MPRKRKAVVREVLPDPKYNDITLTKFMNCLMKKGKKSLYGMDFLFYIPATNAFIIICWHNYSLCLIGRFIDRIASTGFTYSRYKFLP